MAGVLRSLGGLSAARSAFASMLGPLGYAVVGCTKNDGANDDSGTVVILRIVGSRLYGIYLCSRRVVY